VIRDDGWLKYCIWEHSATVKELYARRCQLLEEEMTCAAQAAELLAPLAVKGDTLLDAGCGSGYFFHSLRARDIPVEYYGIDAAPSLIDIGRRYMPAHGLPADRLNLMRIEDLNASADHVICMNVLSNIDNYHRPLERLLHSARKTLILRESFKEQAEYAYVIDHYLDDGCDIKVYVNAYPIDEVVAFIQSYGFSVQIIEDWRTRGKPELVIDYPHYWTFLVAERINE
jgi:ubiquinone/menaquinone biosynthesis C-methylase UbiE